MVVCSERAVLIFGDLFDGDSNEMANGCRLALHWRHIGGAREPWQMSVFFKSELQYKRCAGSCDWLRRSSCAGRRGRATRRDTLGALAAIISSFAALGCYLKTMIIWA